jgi:hypothetical protein
VIYKFNEISMRVFSATTSFRVVPVEWSELPIRFTCAPVAWIADPRGIANFSGAD